MNQSRCGSKDEQTRDGESGASLENRTAREDKADDVDAVKRDRNEEILEKWDTKEPEQVVLHEERHPWRDAQKNRQAKKIGGRNGFPAFPAMSQKAGQQGSRRAHCEQISPAHVGGGGGDPDETALPGSAPESTCEN